MNQPFPIPCIQISSKSSTVLVLTNFKQFLTNDNCLISVKISIIDSHQRRNRERRARRSIATWKNVEEKRGACVEEEGKWRPCPISSKVSRDASFSFLRRRVFQLPRNPGSFKEGRVTRLRLWKIETEGLSSAGGRKRTCTRTAGISYLICQAERKTNDASCQVSRTYANERKAWNPCASGWDVIGVDVKAVVISSERNNQWITGKHGGIRNGADRKRRGARVIRIPAG